MEIRIVQDGMPQALQTSDYASFLRRLAAWVVDGLVQYIFLPFGINRLVGWSDEWSIMYLSVYSIGFITFGATPGMYLARIRVVDQRGHRPGLFRATVRQIIPGLPWILLFSVPALLSGDVAELYAWSWLLIGPLAMLLWIGDPLFILTDKKRRAFHDKLARTVVLPKGNVPAYATESVKEG